MIIIIPKRGYTITARIARPHQPRFLRFIFSNDIDMPSLASLTRCISDFRQDVRLRTIEDLLRRIQPQTIKVKFVHPIARV